MYTLSISDFTSHCSILVSFLSVSPVRNWLFESAYHSLWHSCCKTGGCYAVYPPVHQPYLCTTVDLSKWAVMSFTLPLSVVGGLGSLRLLVWNAHWCTIVWLIFQEAPDLSYPLKLHTVTGWHDTPQYWARPVALQSAKLIILALTQQTACWISPQHDGKGQAFILKIWLIF